jgi:23S rRNA (adenine2503-C2)-methyltransferase
MYEKNALFSEKRTKSLKNGSKITFQGLNRADLEALLLPHSKNEKQARNEMSDLSKPLRLWLQENIEIRPLETKDTQLSKDGTFKALWKLGDGKTIESVIIPAARSRSQTESSRVTACISSQVGCAMKCNFCLTGTQGIERNLETWEIVTQLFLLKQKFAITNIVFMGMGEPLQNLDNVVKACEILLDQDGFNFSKRKVTVSTSGIVPAIDELGRRIDVSLAISLNASTDEKRSQIMPVNKRWNIQSLLDACRRYPLGSHRRITFEYVLIKDFNDSIEDAANLIALLVGIPSKINLIPMNEHPGSDWKRPTDERILGFQDYLLRHEMTATVRSSRGRDILAACGQLKQSKSPQSIIDMSAVLAEPQ